MEKIKKLIRLLYEKFLVDRYDRQYALINKQFLDDKDNFQCDQYDNAIAEITQKWHSDIAFYDNCSDTNIGIIASTLYGIGGHTKCLWNLIQSFHREYRMTLFLTRVIRHSRKQTIRDIKNKIKVQSAGFAYYKKNYRKTIFQLYRQIIRQKINLIFVYIHTDDIVASAVLSLLKKHSDVKVILFNHADTLPSLSFRFSDLILDARPAGQQVTIELRGYKNTIKIPLQSKKKVHTKYYSQQEKKRTRKELTIEKNDYFSLSGFSPWKIFDGNKSPYLEMIGQLLATEPRLKHVMMTDFCIEQQQILENIIPESLRRRLIVIPMRVDYDKIFQSCDVFIDSFPQGVALTHIDIMRNKRPTVIKINKEKPEKSFEYYLPKDYQYMYLDVEKMKKGILQLLHDPSEQQRTAQKLYQYYLEHYEFDIVKEKYREIIEKTTLSR